MYRCREHGVQEHDWCEPCRRLLVCDHSEQTATGLKYIELLTHGGSHYVALTIHHCATCGQPESTEFN